jgi:hypothetical protein
MLFTCFSTVRSVMKSRFAIVAFAVGGEPSRVHGAMGGGKPCELASRQGRS